MSLLTWWLYYIDVEDFDVFLWLLFVRPYVLDFVDDVQPLSRTPEDGVLSVQPRLHQQLSVRV